MRRRVPLLPVIAGPVLAVLAMVEALADPGFRAQGWPYLLIAVWFLLASLLQAALPATGALLACCIYPVGLAIGVPAPTGTGLLAATLAVGYAGYAATRPRSIVAAACGAAVFVVTDLVVHGLQWNTVFFPVVFVPAWAAGRLVARERERTARLERLTAQIEAQRERELRAAAQAERNRIARDVHDAVAHSVSVMTLTVGGLRRQLAPALEDRPAEREALLAVERLGRETVDELRTLVGILHEPADDEAAVGTRVSTPSLLGAEDVVEDVRAAGLDVGLTVLGERRPLPRALDASGYRILQEALTNVLRHAAGSRAEVTIEYQPDQVVLQVHDDGRGPSHPLGTSPGGHGIPGMRERAAVFGGDLVAGPDGGGFRVTARLPLPQEAS